MHYSTSCIHAVIPVAEMTGSCHSDPRESGGGILVFRIIHRKASIEIVTMTIRLKMFIMLTMIAALTVVTLVVLYIGIKREERLITSNALSQDVLENSLLLSGGLYRYFMKAYDYMAVPHSPAPVEGDNGRSPAHLQSIEKNNALILDRLEHGIHKEIAHLEGAEKIEEESELQLLQEIRVAYSESLDDIHQALRLYSAGDQKQALQFLQNTTEAQFKEQLRGLLHTLVEGERREVAEIDAMLIRSGERLTLLVIATSLFTLALSIFIVGIMMRAITQPVQKLMQGTLAISAGDLSYRISHDGTETMTGEFSELAKCFNKMAADLMSQRDALLITQSSLERKNTELSIEIRERIQAEDKARQHQAQLAHVLRLNTVSEIATSIAHEVNNPLSVIINYTRGCERRLAAAGDIDKSALKDVLEQIGAQAERAAKIVRRIRNFSRGVESERVLTNINHIIHDVTLIADFEARQHNITLRSALSSATLPVVVDRIQINQVLWNLIINAIEAIAGSNSTRREIEISQSRIDEHYAEIAVRDTGPGLAEEDLQRIFDAFFTTKPEGMGMGLAISRSIIESHGGHLWATHNQGPNQGGGLTFRIKLPLAQGTQESIPNAS